jgi:hypothetical protein
MENPKASKAGDDRSKTGLRIRVAAASLLTVGLIAWLALKDDEDSKSGSTGGAEIVSIDSLRDVAAEQDIPIYWAGEQEGTELELSQPGEGRTYVRYLTGDGEVDDPRPFLTVGTYARVDAVGTLKRQSEESGGILAKAPGGATVYFKASNPRSVYLAYPGVDAQIEVYDPDFERALQLVNSGQIVSAG